jgi:hypothetical protein
MEVLKVEGGVGGPLSAVKELEVGQPPRNFGSAEDVGLKSCRRRGCLRCWSLTSLCQSYAEG